MANRAYEAIVRARNQASGGNPTGAVDTLEAYLATDPHNTEPRLVLANILVKDLDETEYGMMQLDIILDLEPDNVKAMLAKVSVLSRDKKKTAETDSLFTRILELSPTADNHGQYAMFAKHQLTDFPKARKHFEKAIALDPSNPVHHQNYAALLLNDLKDYPAAKTELETLMSMKPGDSNIKKNYERLIRQKFDGNGNPKKRLFGRRVRQIRRMP